MSNRQSQIDGFSIYDLEADLPTPADAAAGGMRIGTVILTLNEGRVRRLIDDAGVLKYACLASEKLSGTATILAGTPSVDVSVPGMGATGVALVSLVGSAFDATLTGVLAKPGTDKFTIVGNANATADTKVAWLVTKLT